MADKLPLKAIPASGDATALQEFEAGDTNGVAIGGIGLSTIAADQMLYSSALDTLAVTSLTAWGRARAGDASNVEAKAALAYGTAADANIGTSGATVPLLSTANTWTLAQDYSAAGIYIGGSAADNLLNQYDKNLNWTPVVTVATTGDLSIVYGVQVGRAQQVGNRVDFNLRLTMSTFTYTTASGALYVSLPATSSSAAQNYSSCSCSITGWIAPAGYSALTALIPSGSSVIEIKEQPNNGGTINTLFVTEIPPTPTSPTIFIHIAGSYEV